MASQWKKFRQVVQRKRIFEPEQLECSDLRRCLTRWDLTGLGLGSTLGVGIYVLVGSVALRTAGPSIVLSFLIAAVASLFAGLCYAELGARVPKAGSAYIYTYVTVGEFVAFIIGWNMILEGLFGTASVARGLSTYVDSMADGAMSAWCTSIFPISAGWFSPYFDLFAFCIVIMLGVLLTVGARESSMVNNVLALVNMTVILFIIIAGSFTAKTSNWSIPASEVPENYGDGGFFPYGVWGTLKGAALCFYGFVGFDAISATGEEVREPRRTIPQAILTVLCVVFVVYASVSAVVTMMVPYYDLDKVAAVATAFSYVHWEWARWVVSVGAVFGISASLFGAMFPLPRVLYAMASDGLLLHWFSHVSPGRKTPLVATLVPACIISVLAAVVELEQLILMMCIGTLFSYTIVAACVVILRYRSKYKPDVSPGFITQAFGFGDRTPSKYTSRVVIMTLLLYICICISTALIGVNMENPMIPVVALHAAGLILLVVIALQPQAKEDLSFKTPLVPVIPCLSIYVNVHLMILVNMQTWIRILVWVLIGIIVYILCLSFYKRPGSGLKDVTKHKYSDKNGKIPVQIVVEAPTPPETVTSRHDVGGDHSRDMKLADDVQTQESAFKRPTTSLKTDEIIVQQAIVENNEEKEAKIIDLLDQVLQAEEDSYKEHLSLKEEESEKPDLEIMVPLDSTKDTSSIPHRKSLSELSDAGSEISFSNQDTKYSVIAQVHREDLPKVREEEEKLENEVNDATNENLDEYEQVTAFNDSETNSRTDESGYSDTLDRYIMNNSVEDDTDEIPRIPTPPPLDEKYFSSPYMIKKSYSIPERPSKQKSIEGDIDEGPKESFLSNTSEVPYIPPPPPPLDENYFSSPYMFKKSYSIPARQTKQKSIEEDIDEQPRKSVLSNVSQDDGNIVFGSSRQMKFMNKLNNIFQNKMTPDTADEEQRKRSNSTGDVTKDTELAPQLIRERPSLFLDLKKELALMHSVPNLRPVSINIEDTDLENKNEDSVIEDDGTTTEDSIMSREDLKSKLETIFSTGGPKLLKPRHMQSNPPTPEESYQTDTSSTESISKLPKMEKNDTLKRQKDKFSEVLNSFRLSLNKDDEV